MNSNKPVLNASKMEIIIFGPSLQLNRINVTSIALDEVNVSLVNSIGLGNLGVAFDSQLSFEQHSRQLSSS